MSMRKQVMGAVKVFDEFTVKYDAVHRAYWTNTLSEDDLKQWHEAQLRTVLRKVKNKSAFYAGHLKDINVDGVTLALGSGVSSPEQAVRSRSESAPAVSFLMAPTVARGRFAAHPTRVPTSLS